MKLAEVIKQGKEIHREIIITKIRGYHDIGNLVNSFYLKNYGEDMNQQIADGIGVSSGLLRKARQFARQYSAEQVDLLFEGAFVMPWYAILGNLSLEADIVITLYSESTSAKEFLAKAKAHKGQQTEGQESGKPTVCVAPKMDDHNPEESSAPSEEENGNTLTNSPGSEPADPGANEAGSQGLPDKQNGVDGNGENQGQSYIPKADKKKATQEDEIEILKEEISRIKAENETLQEVYKSLKAENIKLKIENAEKNSRIAAMELEIEELQEKLDNTMECDYVDPNEAFEGEPLL